MTEISLKTFFCEEIRKIEVRRDSGQSRAHIYDGRERRSVHRKKQTQVSLVFSLLLPLESVFLLGVEFSTKLWSCQQIVQEGKKDTWLKLISPRCDQSQVI